MKASIESVERICAEHFGLTVSCVRMKTRTDRLCIARRVTWKMLVDCLKLQHGEVAGLYGMTRTNIWHGLHRLQNRIATDPTLAAKIAALRVRLAKA